MVSNHMFQVKYVVNAGPNREGFRHMLKTSELGQGLQKGLWSLGWPDQESRLAPSCYQMCQEDPQGNKKSEENSRIIWRHFRRPKIQARFDPNHKTWQLHLSGMQQHSQELMIPGASPLPRGPPAYTLGARGCWRHQPWTHKNHVLLSSFDSCFGHHLGLRSHCNTVTLVSVPASHMTVEDQEMLSDMGGYGSPFCRWKSTSILYPGCFHCKNIPGSKKGFFKSSFARTENWEWTMRDKGIFLAGNRTVFALSSSVKSMLPR